MKKRRQQLEQLSKEEIITSHLLLEGRVGDCTCCGADLAGLAQHEVGRHQVLDIPRVPVMVRAVIRYGRYCPECETYQRAGAPPGFETGRVFGPNLEQVVLYLHYAHPLSYQRVQQIVADLYDLKLSVGTLVNLVQRTQTSLQKAATHIHEQLQRAPVIGSDETVDGLNQWQWVFQNVGGYSCFSIRFLMAR